MKRGAILFLTFGLMATAAWGADPAISMLEDNVLWVRPTRVTDGLSEQLLALPATNRIAGTILDLRFADGDDGAVDAAVKLFSSKKVPLVILANAETRGGAAELAARLRTAGVGLIIGSTNSAGKISPDIDVAVTADAERSFQVNPYLVLPSSEAGLSATNDLLPIIDHTSEAELVREKVKDGEEDDAGPTARPEPPQPVIRDPEVARAMDLIKALAILQTTGS